MVDYKLLADDDPGGDLDTAYAAMAAETVTTTPQKRMNYLTIANEVGFNESTALAAQVEANLPSWVNNFMLSDGVDVNDAQTAGLVNSLVGGSFTTQMATDILASGSVSVLKYPNLKVGHLANARQKRLAGEI